MAVDLQEKEYYGKVVVVGDGACGKTCLLEVFRNNQFPKEYVPTVVDNFVKNVTVDGKDVGLTLWDTAGQEDFDAVRPLSYEDTSLVLLCYSIDNKELLPNVRNKWLFEISNYCPKAKFFLVGLKSDKRDDPDLQQDKIISFKEGEKLSSSINAMKFFECSAKEGTNVNVIFEEAARYIVTLRESSEGSSAPGRSCCGLC